MSDSEELRAIVAAAQAQAVGAYSSNLSQQRADIQARYDAEEYGDEEPDMSAYVDTTVRDTVESIKPELMDIFFGADRVIEFTPKGAEDIEGADQETEVINHVFTGMNNGYKVALDWFHDALTFRNGYVKRYWDEVLEPEVEQYGDLTDEERFEVMRQAVQRGETEVSNEEIDEEGRHSFTLTITPDAAHKYVVESVSPDEILVAQNWHKLDFEGCPYVSHKRIMPVSDLVAMGFDQEQAMSLPSVDPQLDSAEKEQRFGGRFGAEYGGSDGVDELMRPVLVYENYIRTDQNGDGIAELLQVYTGGDECILLQRDGEDAIQAVDAAPFNVLSPIPIPHKHYGLGVADLVMDTQRVRTVMMRQMINNMVAVNNPETHVDEMAMTDSTVEDLAVTGPGRVIRIRGGGASITTAAVPPIVQNSLAALEAVKADAEQRTGVTRLNQGLDPDALQGGARTMGGMKALMTSAQKKLLLIARNFAETGFRQLFLDIHRDLRKGPMKRIAMRLRNEWVQVDPRLWKTRSDMSVNVGLGTGDRDAQFAALAFTLEQQKEALPSGLVHPRHIHHTLTKMLEMRGFKDVEAFFPEPPEGPMQAPDPGPGPEEILAQVEMAKTEAKKQTDMAKMQSDAALKREQSAMDAKIAAEKLLLESRTAGANAEIEKAKLALETAKLELEREKAGLAARELELRAVQADAAVRSSDHSIRSELEKYEVNRDEILGHVAGAMSPELERLVMEGRAAMDRIEELSEELSRARDDSGRDLDEIAKALAAPKQIILDEDGRPVGVKADYKSEVNGAAGQIVKAITGEKRLVRDADGKPRGVE